MRAYYIFFLSWLFPGAGHFLQKKHLKAAVFLTGIVLLLVLGMVMNGKFYKPYTITETDIGIKVKHFHPLLILGFLGDLGSGIFYFLFKLLGYAGKIESVTFHYGTTYIVSAGLLNYLVALNAFDIARGRRK